MAETVVASTTTTQVTKSRKLTMDSHIMGNVLDTSMKLSSRREAIEYTICDMNSVRRW